MTTEPAKTVRSIDSEQRPPRPTIDRGRYTRAVIEAMTVEREADRLYRVTSADANETYHVDVENGGCTCADQRYRGEIHVCKHVLKACLVEVFANTVSTELVARVVAFTREAGCPCGGIDCDGPVGPRLPCPGCLDAVRSDGVDEWTVWLKAVTEERA